jgi:hypothetical protein
VCIQARELYENLVATKMSKKDIGMKTQGKMHFHHKLVSQ